ncbi:MAG: hypothetical protein ACRDL0_22100 [Thermoleophilaceae bacterium]
MTGVPGDLLPAHPLRPVKGDEQIVGVHATVLDFWRWGFSDLRLNIVRGVLAEFLVAKVIGATETPKEEWANFDVRTPAGVPCPGICPEAWAISGRSGRDHGDADRPPVGRPRWDLERGDPHRIERPGLSIQVV